MDHPNGVGVGVANASGSLATGALGRGAAIPMTAAWGSRGRKTSKGSASETTAFAPGRDPSCMGPFEATIATGSGRPRRGAESEATAKAKADSTEASDATAGWSAGRASGLRGT